ncbi:MAG: hypothetical protein JWR16_1635 [Nevskia sp.]|nr:hypothetical protein [Nevskia sp.]
MAASIHPLFPGSAATGADAAERAAAEQHPLVVALRDATLAVLKESLRQLFDRADDLLFEMGEKASNDAERRRYFDTMRVLRLENSRVTQTFAADFSYGFAPTPVRTAPELGEFDLDRLAIQPTEELEERIAIANMAAKAEGLFKNALWEVERRLQIAAREFGVPVSPRALSPSRICEAFGAAIGELDTEFQIKLVVYKLLDRSVLRDFERVYAIALDLLDRDGIDATRKSAPRASAARADVAATTSAASGASELLRQFGLDPNHLQKTNEPTAAELGRLLQTLLTSASTPAAQASTQRLSMAAQLLQEMLAEPLLPPALRPTIENLRYPVYRSALTDASFFSDAAHPLRTLLADLVESGVNAHAGNADAQTQLRELLRHVASLDVFNPVSPAGIGASGGLASAPGLDAAEAEHFMQQLREQTRARREALLMRVRRQIAQELEVQTLGRDVPAQVMKLLRSGIGPLMALRLLRNGHSSTAFQGAQDLLKRVLHSLEFMSPPTSFELQSRDELIVTIATALGGVGMEGPKIETLLQGLQDVYALLDGNDAGRIAPLTPAEEQLLRSDVDPGDTPVSSVREESPLPSVTVMELLGRVLTPESWYRVFDADQNQTRWLKLASFYPQQDSILFSGFDETSKLRLRAQRFAADLAQGFSEPINPGAAAREALEQLRSAKSRGVF